MKQYCYHLKAFESWLLRDQQMELTLGPLKGLALVEVQQVVLVLVSWRAKCLLA